MKVLQVIESGGVYGAEAVVLSLSAGLLARGVDCEIASIATPDFVGEKPIEVEARSRGVPVRRFTMNAGPSVFGAIGLIRYANRTGCSLLHTHGYKATVLLGGLPRAVRRIPVVSTVHGRIRGEPYTRQRLYERLERLALYNSDRVIAVSREMARTWNFDHSYGDRLRVIHNGIEETAGPVDAAQSRLHKSIQQFISGSWPILAVGRLSAEKGFDSALAAFQKLRAESVPARLVIAGDGPKRRELAELSATLGIAGEVLFPGYVPQVRRIMPRFQALLMTSRTEGVPIVLLEALSAGLPVIATGVGGIPEILDTACGVLVPPGDIQRITAELFKLFREPEVGESYKAAALKRSKVFSSSQMVASYLDVYSSIKSR